MYYSNNSGGQPVNPRIAIRMNGKDRIAEIRGVDENQNLDKNISESSVLDEKLKDFGDEGEIYKVRVDDIKRVTQIEEKLEKDGELGREDLRFIFEIDRNIEGLVARIWHFKHTLTRTLDLRTPCRPRSP